MSKSKIKAVLLILIMTLVALIVVFRISDDHIPNSGGFDESLSDTELIEGKNLSTIYCAACHAYPEPGLLPKSTWETQTLPAMGSKMGVFQHNGIEYPVDSNHYVPENYYPSEPVITEEDWEKILGYYLTAAPEAFQPVVRNPEIITDSLFFKPHTAGYQTDFPPTATVARFDPGNKLLYLSDIDGTNFLIFNRDLELENTLYLSSTLADVRITSDKYTPGIRDLILTYLGSMHPSDAPEGFIVKTSYDPDPNSTENGAIDVVSENLVRPVQAQSVDIDMDGLEDLLVNEFGHRTGQLFWLKNTGNTFEPEKRVLIDSPGCIQSHITDYTENGLPDIFALCTQSEQKIYLLENIGDGKFNKKTLLQFPVTAGSSSFELVDFNGNGHPDILYTSGDNADFSVTFKPYHGVHIYLNDGNDNFTEAWFYPINGAYNAKARDFNGSGFLDIAVISFFGDYVNRPEEGFVLFINDGVHEDHTLSFTPYHPPAASAGRWLTMDVADWTGNGFDDILLANYSLGPDVTDEQARANDIFTRGPLFLLLENLSE